MTKIAMPEPMAIAYAGENGLPVFTASMDGALSLRDGDTLITTTQAEAYKDACVRAAVEDVINTLETRQFGGQDQIIRFLRALLPPTE